MRSSAASVLLSFQAVFICILLSSCLTPSAKKDSYPPPASAVQVPASQPTLSPSRGSLVLASASPRTRQFLLELQTRVLQHDWQWISKHAERSHYERFVQKRGKLDKQYTAEVFQLGDSYRKSESNFIPEKRQLDLDSVTYMEFSVYRKEKFTSVVKGYLSNDEGIFIDFSLNVLDELKDVLLSGD